MKKITTTITLLFLFALTSFSQEKDIINPFTYGKEVNSIETNFENLRRNIKHLIDNPQDIQFLGYDYIETIQNEKDAIKYLSENLRIGAYEIAFMVTDTQTINGKGEKESGQVIKIEYGKIPNVKNNKDRIQHFVNKLAKNIKQGYEVYRIDFALQDKKMNYNVFVDPKTKQVNTQYNAFLIPARMEIFD